MLLFISKNEKYFITASSDKTIRIWNFEKKKCV